MYMIALDDRKLNTANVHNVFHQRFKKPTTHIVLIIIQLLMRLNTYLGRPLRRRTPDLLLGIAGVLIDTNPINLVINGRVYVIEHVVDTSGQSTVLVPIIFIEIVFITGTSVRTDGKS